MASPSKQNVDDKGAPREYDDDEHDDDGEESYYSEQSDRNGDDRSFYSQDSRRDDRSNHHESYRSKEGSYVSGEGSYRSDERSYRSGEGSYRSGEGSYRSGEGSYRSRGRSYRSGEGSYRSGEGSYRSGDGSYRSRERSYRSGEGSHRSGERSYRSGEGSYRSGEGSYRSGEGSYRSRDRSYRSGERSYRSGDGSYRSREGSNRSRERSYRSGEGSYRSGEGSYRSGEGSYRSGERSYRSGEGSYRSGEGSYRSGDGSYRSKERSYRSGEGSYRSGEGSYRSGEGSYHSKGADRSLRSEEQSNRNGDESFLSSKGTEKNGDSMTKSFAEEDGQSSFHSDSNRSGGSHDERFSPPAQSGPTSSPRNTNRQDNSQGGDEKSFHSNENSYDENGEPYDDEGDGSDYSDDDEDVASFGEEVVEEPVIQPKSPSQAHSASRSFQDSRFSTGTSSEMDSAAPSFAEESVFSPYNKSPKNVVNASTDLFGKADFGDVNFGGNPVTDDEEGESAFPSKGFSGDVEAAFDDFGSNAFGGDAFPAMETKDGFGEEGDAFSSAFDTNVFGSSNIGTEDFATSAFGTTEEFSAFPSDNNDKVIFDSDDKTDSGNDRESNDGSSKGTEGKIPAGESTNSFAQQPGDVTEPESSKSDAFATKSAGFHDNFDNAFGSSFAGPIGETDLAFEEANFDQQFNNDSGLHNGHLPDQSFNRSIGSSVPPPPEVDEGASIDGKSDAWDEGSGGESKPKDFSGREDFETSALKHEAQDSNYSGMVSENRSFHSEERSQRTNGSQSETKSFQSGDVGDESFQSRDHDDGHPNQRDNSFHSENRSPSQRSLPENESRGSSRSHDEDDKSFHSGDESQGSLARDDDYESRSSYRSGDPAEERSFYSDGGSQRSYRSGDQYESKSFHSNNEARSESAKSFHSGDDSRNSNPNESKPLETSFHSEEESQGSYHSRSVHSDEKSQGSYHSRSQDSYHSRSFHSKDRSQGSYRSRSFHSEGGSQGSYHSSQSGDRSLRPEDESQGSYISNEGPGTDSFQSMGASTKSERKREQPEHESYQSKDQSEGKSFHSEDESRNSFQSGTQSDTKSFHSEDESRGSFKGTEESESKSFYSEDASGKSFQSGDQSNVQSFYSEDGSQEFNGSEVQMARTSNEGLQSKTKGTDQTEERAFDAEGSMMSSVLGNDSRLADEKASSSAGQSQRQEIEENQSLADTFQSETNSRTLEADPTLEDRSVREGEESARMGEESYRSADESQQSIDEELSNYQSQSSSGSSFAHDDVPENEADINSRHIQSREPEVQRNENDPSMNEDEESIGIGDVFGKPNEFFEDQPKSTPKAVTGQSQKEESYKSEATQDDTVDDRSKMSPRVEDPQKSMTEHEPIAQSPAPVGQAQSAGTEPSKPRNQERETEKKAVSRQRQKEDPEERKKRKKRKKKVQREAKSRALLDLVANVNDAMLELEERDAQASEGKENNMDTSAHRLLHGFDALLGIYLQLSDELELISTFAKAKKKKDRDAMPSVQALKAVLSFAATLDELFADLKPIILECFDEEPDEEMDDMLYRLNSLVDLLYETTHRVGERQEWNERAETTYVTLLELMDREATELISYYEDVETPEQVLSANIHEAWSATGHIEELRALQYASDPWLFRQLCYEVMVSTDQWCPDTTILMEICGIDPSMLEEEPDDEYLEEDELPLIPQAAEHVLDKVNGDPLPRTATLASILRRILPPRAVTDVTLLDHFTSIRNTLRNPLGLSATNIVSISSVAEQPSDPDSLGVGGIGKTTLAAMVARHPDVRRYFIDGVVWVYVGDKELNYNRYTQCLRELVAQLDFYQGVPLFAELLHVPGETLSKRRRREEGFMIYARDTIAELLHDKSVLIILDDVCFEPDLDWFDFAPMPGEETDDFDSNCALLVTTRCRTLLPAADTVEVDMLDEADAISLLIQESGQLSHTLMAESREARSVVRECANHPLAVKSVGRWLNLKHATAGVVSSVEEIHSEVIKSMDKILKGGDHTGTDMMYEILSMSLSPAINGEPTSIIKFCLAAFIIVFCDRQYISDFALTEPSPIIPMDMAELLFETLLEMNESSLLQKGSLFYAQKKEAAVLIPEALSALGVLKVITYSDAEDEENPDDEQKFLQVMHFIHHEYGEYLSSEEEALKELTKDAERQWNRALVEAYLSQVEAWDMDLEDAGHSYALEMIISHMIRGGMYSAAADLLADKSFVRGRLLSLGRENATRRHIKDCEMLFKKLRERRPKGSKLEPRTVMKQAYQALGSQLAFEDEEQSIEDSRIKDVEVARAHYEIGFSLAEKRCWDAAIAHWETSQELLVSALGTVEIVAGILFNIGVVYSEMNEYEQALDSLKKCLRIRGTIHGEDHILYAQTIQKIGDVFLGMSDYHEATESYNWALDVMYLDPNIHRVEIGEILDNKGTIHYSKGEIDEALQCHQEALRSKQVELGEDHPELSGTYHHIGNCLSDQGNVDDAIVHFEEAIRLKEIDPEGGPERDADVLTIEGILHNLEGNQEQGLECYEKSLQILVTKVPHRKEKVASLLHLIGCVYLMSGEQKKAMKLFEESLQARRKVLGFVHLDVASTLFNMAFLHQTRNRLDRALKCLEEALKIRQLRLPDSEKVAVTHEKIGSLARAIGKTKKAQINFEDALRIRRLLHGEQHEAVATVLQELGDLMDDLGEYDSAMSYYIDALDIRRNRLGLDDIAVAETLYSMGYTLHNNDEPDRALVCFEESLNIRRYQLGEDSKEVGDTLNMMGFLKAKRSELDDALTLLWDALRIRKLQEDHVKVSETLKNIGNVHREKKELDLAVECYEECLRIRRSELGPDHEKVADALIAMGNVQSDMERNDEAMRSYQEALKIRTLVFGEHDESVAAVLQYMGTMEFRANNHDKARDLLTEFIRIRRDNDTKNDGDYVNVLFMIGNIHKMQSREDEAQACWSEAYQVFQELGLAETNPQIAKVMSHLLNLDEQKEDTEQKKKGKGGSMFGKVTEKFKGNLKEEKSAKKKARKGKGIQL